MHSGKSPVILLNMAVDVHNTRECEILISQYAERVSDSGAVPMLIPSLEKTENIAALLALADGVLLIGGKDYDPKYYGCEVHPETSLARMRPHFDLTFGAMALETKLPLLGICAGCQLLNIVSGGKLIQHLPGAEKHMGGTTHEAVILEHGFLARSLDKSAGQSIVVNSFHHQAVDPAALGADFIITAAAFDGSVEAIEQQGQRMVLGVQFHPERMDDLGPRLFAMLTEEAMRYRHSAALRRIFPACGSVSPLCGV